MTVPRRKPPSQAERLRNIANAQNSARGLTQWARRPSQVARGTVNSGASEVVTGTGDVSSVSITSTTEGAGDSAAPGLRAVAIGPTTAANGDQSVAIGYGSTAHTVGAVNIGWGNTVYGAEAVMIGTSGTVGTSSADSFSAVGVGQLVQLYGDKAIGVGWESQVGTSTTPVANGVAIGNAAHATEDNEMALGASSAIVKVRGKFVVADTVTGDLYQLKVSGGTLTVVAYP